MDPKDTTRNDNEEILRDPQNGVPQDNDNRDVVASSVGGVDTTAAVDEGSNHGQVVATQDNVAAPTTGGQQGNARMTGQGGSPNNQDESSPPTIFPNQLTPFEASTPQEGVQHDHLDDVSSVDIQSVTTDGCDGSKKSSLASLPDRQGVQEVDDLEAQPNAENDQSAPRYRRYKKQATDSTAIISNQHNPGHDAFFGSTIYADDDQGDDVADDLTDDGASKIHVGPLNGDHHHHHHHHHHDGKSLGWGRGIRQDFVRTTGTHWTAEMTNFESKTLAVTAFLFFACVAPAITFGAIYSKVTGNQMGAVEMLVATAWCGMCFALIGGQPVVRENPVPFNGADMAVFCLTVFLFAQMINGGTGPVLAFSGVLYKLSESIGVPFLTFNAWCGLWVAFYLIIAGVVDLNQYIRYATRFTDEIFALLIAAIFIIDALGSPFQPVGVFHYFSPSHDWHQKFEDDPEYNYIETALLSLVLCVGTTTLAIFFRGLKHSPYLWSKGLRNCLADFSVSLSIFIFAVIAKVGFAAVQTEELNVPDTLAPTFVCCTLECNAYWPDDCPELDEPYGRRPWLVNLFNLNGKGYVPVVAAIPAILAFILLFLDEGITIHLMNHPGHKLTHGTAYNYDTTIIGLMVAINSMLGLPWLVAATVRSLNHLHALAEKSPDGKVIYSILETRLTSLFAHSLILASLFALSIIRLIPVPVLYGVFLYMGLTTLGTNQFWNRVMLFFAHPSMYEKACPEPFVENVPAKRLGLYTGIQLFLFVSLYAVKSIKPIAIAFPIIIMACIPIRLFILPSIFSSDELILLDSGDDQLIDQWLEDHGRVRKVRYVESVRSEEDVPHQSICGDYPFDNMSLSSGPFARSRAGTV